MGHRPEVEGQLEICVELPDPHLGLNQSDQQVLH